MKHKTNLQQPQITKILKDLESRTLVKAIRPVNMPSKKFYMLFDLDASEEITGGNWYVWLCTVSSTAPQNGFYQLVKRSCFEQCTVMIKTGTQTTSTT